MYEILNKSYYYTYNIKNDKMGFLSKGLKDNTNQIYDKNVKNIILDNKKYILVKKINKEKEICKLKCINPYCNFSHPENYVLEEAYKQYIIEEKNKNTLFKSVFCNNIDETCFKHKYNKCKFRHKNDPIEND